MKENLVKIKEKYLSLPKPLLRGINFFLLFISIWIAYTLFVPLGKTVTDNNSTIRTLMIIIPVICLCVGFFLYGKGKLKLDTLLLLIMFAGFSLRIGYAFYTGVNTRQHDVEMGSFTDPNYDGTGHFSYIYTIYSTGKLPNSADWQFYHPPLWHILCALFMHILSWFNSGLEAVYLFEKCIILAAFVSCMTLIAFKDLLLALFHKDKFDTSLKSKNNIIIIVSFLLLSFHSQFFVMAGWMNNEGLAFMFSIFALSYAIKFHNDKKWADAILCAITLGCGIMSKVSVFLIAAPIGFILIYDMVSEFKAGNGKRVTLQALTFLGVCIPLAGWFLLRNTIKFGVESLTVPAINPETSHLSVIKYSVWERFGIPNIVKSYSESMFCILSKNKNGYMDYNIWAYTLKCSIFGEYSYWGGDIFGIILLILNTIITPFSLFCIVYVTINDFRKKSEYCFETIVMLIIHILSILSYIGFQVLYPVTCTQDFRYMTLILLPGAYFIARFYSSLDESKLPSKITRKSTLALISLFCVFSTLYFSSCR